MGAGGQPNAGHGTAQRYQLRRFPVHLSTPARFKGNGAVEHALCPDRNIARHGCILHLKIRQNLIPQALIPLLQYLPVQPVHIQGQILIRIRRDLSANGNRFPGGNAAQGEQIGTALHVVALGLYTQPVYLHVFDAAAADVGIIDSVLRRGEIKGSPARQM